MISSLASLLRISSISKFSEDNKLYKYSGVIMDHFSGISNSSKYGLLKSDYCKDGLIEIKLIKVKKPRNPVTQN